MDAKHTPLLGKRTLSPREEELVKALESTLYYATLIVDPNAHGSIYPAQAMKELQAARAAIAKARGEG